MFKWFKKKLPKLEQFVYSCSFDKEHYRRLYEKWSKGLFAAYENEFFNKETKMNIDEQIEQTVGRYLLTREAIQQNKKGVELLREEGERLEKQLKESEKVVFKAGDIVTTCWGLEKRIIVDINSVLWAIDAQTGTTAGADSYGDGTFSECHYTKVGRIRNFIMACLYE